MPQLRFRVSGSSVAESRRWKRLLQHGFIAKIAGWGLVGWAIVYATTGVRAVSLLGVSPGPFTAEGGQFRLSVALIDPRGRLVPEGLTPANVSFTPLLLVDAISPRTTVARATARLERIEVVAARSDPLIGMLLLDNSGSMENNDPLQMRKEAAKRFVRPLGPNDRLAIATFAGRGMAVVQDFTADHEDLERAIDGLGADQGTPLFDSLLAVIRSVERQMMEAPSGNPVIVVLTDGADQNSTATLEDLIRAAKTGTTCTPILCIGLATNEAADTDFSSLRALAWETGGLFASVLEPKHLTMLFDRFAFSRTQGHVVIHARGSINKIIDALPAHRRVVVSGSLIATQPGRRSITTPFQFEVEIRPGGQGHSNHK